MGNDELRRGCRRGKGCTKLILRVKSCRSRHAKEERWEPTRDTANRYLTAIQGLLGMDSRLGASAILNPRKGHSRGAFPAFKTQDCLKTVLKKTHNIHAYAARDSGWSCAHSARATARAVHSALKRLAEAPAAHVRTRTLCSYCAPVSPL